MLQPECVTLHTFLWTCTPYFIQNQCYLCWENTKSNDWVTSYFSVLFYLAKPGLLTTVKLVERKVVHTKFHENLSTDSKLLQAD
jgi:hypothetical protein